MTTEDRYLSEMQTDLGGPFGSSAREVQQLCTDGSAHLSAEMGVDFAAHGLESRTRQLIRASIPESFLFVSKIG